jgi:acyl carrier protein
MARRLATVYHRAGRMPTPERVSCRLHAPFTRFGGIPARSRKVWGGLRYPRRATAAQRLTGEWGGTGVAETFERVRAIVADRLGVDEDKVAMESEFIGDLNADSLDLVEVIMAMEQEFDLEIKDEDAENIRTVADAVQYIDEHGG